MRSVLYFRQLNNYFWEWDPKDETVVITGGNTIAYREFLYNSLKKISTQPLPRFGTLLLAIIATSSNFHESWKQVVKLLDREIKSNNQTSFYSDILEEAEKFLHNLSQLPKEYRYGDNRILVLYTIFQNCHNSLSIKHGKSILKHFKEHWITQEHTRAIAKADFQTFYLDFRPIAILHKRFPSTRSILDAVAGLPKVKEPILLPPEKDETILAGEELIEALQKHPETRILGALIKPIQAGLRIPMNTQLPSEQRFGGVSDITNKGSYDKLLISEFAYDDHTFLSRLANNESLYLHREQPPNDHQPIRYLLIDVSLKNWGSPKLIAQAISLALQEHPQAKFEVRTFLIGARYAEVTQQNIHEVIQTSQILDPTLHAGNGLKTFFQTYETGQAEVFWLGSPDSFTASEFQLDLAACRANLNYAITANPSGNIQLWRIGSHQQKMIHQFQVDIQKANLPTTKKESLPPPIKYRFFPMLCPIPRSAKQVISVEEDTHYIITKKQQLFCVHGKREQYSRYQKGSQLILDKLPVGTSRVAIGKFKDGTTLMLCYKRAKEDLVLINLVTHKKINIPFPGPSQIGDAKLFFLNEYLFYQDFHHTLYVGKDMEWEKSSSKNFDFSTHAGINMADQVAHTKKMVRDFEWQDHPFFNVKSVFIDREHRLHFGNHQLTLVPDLKEESKEYQFITAKAMGVWSARLIANRREFHFAEGSVVKIWPSGMASLISSNRNLPTIFIPLVLHKPLGLATHKSFGGNLYFLPPNTKHHTISVEEFHHAFLQKFITHIVETIEAR